MTRFAQPRPIHPDDEVAGFSCGDGSLDEWLTRRALANHTQGASRTYVSVLDGRVVGYYSLSATSVLPRELSGRVRRNMPDPVPAVLLGRLAVDRKVQHQRLGTHLVRHAILRTLSAADAIGVRVLLVHAASESAAHFYQSLDFEPSPTDPMHLFLLLRDAKAAMESAKDL